MIGKKHLERNIWKGHSYIETGESAGDIMEAVNELPREENLAEGGIAGDDHASVEDISENESAEESVCQSEIGDQLSKHSGKKRKACQSKIGDQLRKHSGKKRKAADGLEDVWKIFGEISRNMNARLETLASRIGYEFELGKARREVFNSLGNIPGLSLDDKFDVCEILAGKDGRLEIFTGLPDSVRPQYVMYLLKTKTKTETKTKEM